MASAVIQEEDILNVVVGLLKFPFKRLWIDYDEEADVLYISFRKPQKAVDSVMEGDIIYHYDDDELVGVTVINAKTLTKA